MIISKNKKFMYVAVPKTATTFTEKHLLEHLGDAQDVNKAQDDASITKLHKHSDIVDLINHKLFNLHDDKFKVAFTRNPYDKIVSWFCYYTQFRNDKKTQIKHKNLYGTKYLSGKFIDFVKYCPPWIWKNSLSFLTDKVGKLHVDFIGRYENFTKDMNYICEKLEIPNIDNKKYVNKSVHKHYTNYYCDETIKITTDRMKLDIEYFKYKYGEI